MNLNSRDFVFVVGKAYTGKTHWIRAHLDKVPKSRQVYIYDFTAEYADFAKTQNIDIWQVRRGTVDEIEEFSGTVYNQGNCTVVFSEADNYLQMNSPILLALVTTGRNRGINAIVDAKRPMSVKPAFRGRFNHLVMFQTTLPEDIEYLEKWTGTGKGSLSQLAELKQGEFITFNANSQELSSVKRL